jgi:hypothetical protein
LSTEGGSSARDRYQAGEITQSFVDGEERERGGGEAAAEATKAKFTAFRAVEDSAGEVTRGKKTSQQHENTVQGAIGAMENEKKLRGK